MAIVYKHIRKDTNEVFYIGIGNDIKRVTSLHHRNPLWHNIVNKVGFDYEIHFNIYAVPISLVLRYRMEEDLA